MAMVEGVGSTSRVAIPGAMKIPRAGAGFALPADPADAAPNAPAGVMAPAVLTGILGLQESPPDAGGDDHARRHASTLLTELVALQRALLGGGDPIAVLGRLDAMVGAIPPTASPALVAVLTAVRLRARVELARRAVTPAG